MRKTWAWPWQYKEAAALTLGLVAVGALLQPLAPLAGRVLAAPASLVLGVALPLASLAVGLSRNRVAMWLTGLPVGVMLMVALLALSLVMGLTGWPLTGTWPFRLVYGALLLALGGVAARGVKRHKSAMFTFLHLGLYIVLLAAGLGAADRQRYTMWVGEGQVEWRGTAPNGFVAELPLAIKLHDFMAEYYPPQVEMDGKELTMSRPRPKRFASDITFLRPGRDPVRQTVEVNKPLTDGGWMVYQNSYDERAGAGSRFSGFELVYDPWLPLVWLGFGLMALGAALMVWRGRRQKNAKVEEI